MKPRLPNIPSLLTATVAVSALALTGCGGDDSSTAVDPTPSASTSTETGDTSDPATGPVIDVTISGDTVTPNGERVDVAVGDEVTLNVTADEAGEIHVHSTPEQELEYDAGTTTLVINDLDRPGVVDVESHSLEKIIVQLEVS